MLDINGETWKILLVSPKHHALFNSQGEYALGVCDNNLKTIYINDEIRPYKMKKVLCHEICHSFMFSYGIQLSLSQEELLADLMATFGQEIVGETNKIFKRIKEQRGAC